MLDTARILRTAADFFEISVNDLKGDSRKVEFAYPRVLVYRAMLENGMSYAAIARRMKRDRSTIVHGCNQAENLMGRLPHLKVAYDAVVEDIRCIRKREAQKGNEERFKHLTGAQVALAKAHMIYLDTEYPAEPDWAGIGEHVNLAIEELVAGFPDS